MLPLAILCALGAIPLSQAASGSIAMDSGGVYTRDHDLVWDGVSYFGLISQPVSF